jgi:hypothetical protein
MVRKALMASYLPTNEIFAEPRHIFADLDMFLRISRKITYAGQVANVGQVANLPPIAENPRIPGRLATCPMLKSGSYFSASTYPVRRAIFPVLRFRRGKSAKSPCLMSFSITRYPLTLGNSGSFSA